MLKRAYFDGTLACASMLLSLFSITKATPSSPTRPTRTGSPVLGEDHRPIQEPETLRSDLVLALNNKARTETEPIGAEENAKRYQLTTKLYAKNEVDLTIAECALLQERIAAIYDSALIVGRVTDLLEGRKIEVAGGVASPDGKR